jgi:AcrR family transcriptional regulator
MQAAQGSVELTVTEAARRTQIVAAAIESVAELGYARASLAKIADRAAWTRGPAPAAERWARTMVESTLTVQVRCGEHGRDQYS